MRGAKADLKVRLYIAPGHPRDLTVRLYTVYGIGPDLIECTKRGPWWRTFKSAFVDGLGA